MAELQEEASRLRSIKERDTDYWNHVLVPWDRPHRQMRCMTHRLAYPLSTLLNTVA